MNRLDWYVKERKLTYRFDSDLRLQVLMHVHQGVTPGGTATVGETVSKPALATKIRHYLPELAETRQNSRS